MKFPAFKIRPLAPEEEILLNRYVMGGAAGIVVTYFAYDPIILACFGIYLSLNAALHTMRRKQIWPQAWRCYAAIALDISMAFAVMMRSAEIMSFFYPLLLWVILGNGFRFGLRYLVVASVLAVLSFGTVVLTTPYWANNQVLGYSLILALIAIPAYSSTLIKKLSKAKEEAEAASRAKSYFLASVSHELRTPLNAIIGYGTHLKQMGLPKKQHDMVEASVLAGEHLLHLIDQLIQIAKSDSSAATVVRQPMRLTDLLTEIRDIMAVRAEDRGISLKITAEPLSDRLVDGPADIIRNILLNLTGNAIKFTESGSVAVSGAIETQDGKAMLCFNITDTGIGISAEAIDKIFEPFQQADDTVMNRFGGTGLGLAICRQLVTQVGGAINVDSALGQGSCFNVSIPVTLLTAASEAEDAQDSTPLTRIIAFGSFDANLLERAQSAGNYAVRKVDCTSAEELRTTLKGIELEEYDIAMVEQDLASNLMPEDDIWQQFATAAVAPVLVSSEQAPDFGEVSIRAAFASVIPDNADFEQLRSAIRIGCSFASRQRSEPNGDSENVGEKAPTVACSVLVADDNRTNRNVLAAILEAAGHKVSQVCDGDEMLETLEQQSFDIVLLDVNMPRLNGIDACSMWRQREGDRSHLPIVGVTADATSETEIRCLSAGMDLRLTKPINAKLLLATIDKFCGTAVPGYDQQEFAPPPLDEPVAPISSDELTEKSSIDATHIGYLRSIGGDVFVADMIESFVEDARECLATMQNAIDNGDADQFRFSAHGFKSSSNNIGAMRLSSICARLENVSDANFCVDRLTFLENVESELSNVLDNLEQGVPHSELRNAS
jgi:two-component system, sensor histidine kinase RpfC